MFADLILNNLQKKGQIKRKSYQRRLPENPNLDYYYIIRESNSNEPVLVEYGFIDNKKDADKLNKNIENYAEAVVESISTYLGYPYNNSEIVEEYTVKSGDTLYSISKRFNISIDELKRINNLLDNNLSIGRILKLKDNNKNNPNYVVQKGDTLYSISKNNNVSVDDIIRINNLSGTQLYIGQELYLPTNEEINNEPENTIVEDYDIYTVKKGDSLWKISQQYNISVDKLIDLNNLKDLTIKINQKILVPKKESLNNNTYIVQKGDSLWSIAKKYSQTVEELKQKNKLTSNLLSIGQEIIV